MVFSLDWNKTLVKANIDGKIFFRQRLNIAILVSDSTRPAEGRTGMPISGLGK